MGIPFYQQTQYRCGAYLAGLLAGIAVAARQRDNTEPNESKRCLGNAGFVTSLLIWVATVFSGPHAVLEYDGRFPTAAALHLALWRPIFGVAVANIVFFCATGRAPRLAGVLGAAAWRPIARLSYSMYLLQFVGLLAVEKPFVSLWQITSDADSPESLRVLATFALAAVFILGSMALALPSYIFVERPGMLLGKLCIDLFPGGRAPGAPSKATQQGSVCCEAKEQKRADGIGQDPEAGGSIDSMPESHESTDVGSSNSEKISESDIASSAKVSQQTSSSQHV